MLKELIKNIMNQMDGERNKKVEKELKELEKWVSRLEEVTGNNYDVYCSDKFLMLPTELLKLGLFDINDKCSLENIKLRKEINQLKQKNKQLEELVTNLLLKLNKFEEVEII